MNDEAMSALTIEEIPVPLPFERKRIEMLLLSGEYVLTGLVINPTDRGGSFICQGAHWTSSCWSNSQSYSY